jgi:hypothetical protein
MRASFLFGDYVVRFSILLTATQAAERLGTSVERVLLWAAQGHLQMAGQDEDGRALFREHVIETMGQQLVALVPQELRRPRKSTNSTVLRKYGTPLQCGCNPARSAFYLCRTGAALNAALQLAEGLAAAMPSDALLRKLAGLCRDALARHLVDRQQIIEPSSHDKRISAQPPPGHAAPIANDGRLTSEIQT